MNANTPHTRHGGRPAEVDADLVRLHLHTLLAAGLTLTDVARAARVPEDVLRQVCGGSGRPVRRVPAQVARRVLDVAAGDARVGATGWLRALVAAGWPQTVLAARLGVSPSTVVRALAGDNVRAAIAGRVRDLYQEVRGLDPTSVGARPADVAHSRAVAARHGWQPPAGGGVRPPAARAGRPASGGGVV